MKKLFLICLMMLAGSAWAEWVMFSDSDSGTSYFDPATIRKEGNMRRVWELQDLRKRGKNGEMSRRLRKEYDCKQERSRFFGLSGHSESMALGTVLWTVSESNNWTEIPPNTADEAMLQIVCVK